MTYYYFFNKIIFNRTYRVDVTCTLTNGVNWSAVITAASVDNGASLGSTTVSTTNITDTYLNTLGVNFLNSKLSQKTLLDVMQFPEDLFYVVYRVMPKGDGTYYHYAAAYLDSGRTTLMCYVGEQNRTESELDTLFVDLIALIDEQMHSSTITIYNRTYHVALEFIVRLGDRSDYNFVARCVDTNIPFPVRIVSSSAQSYVGLLAFCKSTLEDELAPKTALRTVSIVGQPNHYAVFRVMVRNVEGNTTYYSHWAAMYSNSARTQFMFRCELAAQNGEYILEGASQIDTLLPEMEGQLVRYYNLL